MAKDQKGHGSNKRGVKVWGTGKKADPNRQTILVHRDEKGYITDHTENGKSVSRSYAMDEVGRGNAKLQDAAAANALASGPKSNAAPVHEAMKITGNGGVTDQGNRVGMTKKYDPGHRDSNAFQHDYHPESVNKAIENSGRFGGGKIGKREGRMIHAILKGRGR